jgi:hypothetical protein
MYSELEVNVVSVERVNEYSELTTERELVSLFPPDQQWPQHGQFRGNVVFIAVCKQLTSLMAKYCYAVFERPKILKTGVVLINT